MTKNRVLPESPLQDKLWLRSLEQDLAHFLHELAEQFQKNRSNPLPAFIALNDIASYVWKKNEPPPLFVPVPWWAVQALAIGFNKYREGALSTPPLTLGEAYSLEGGGQGSQRRIKRALQELRDIRIATAIAFADANAIKIEALLQEQADLTGLSVPQVRRIWEKNRKRAKNAVKNFSRA